MKTKKADSNFTGAYHALKMLTIAISMAVLWPVASYATYTVSVGVSTTVSGTWHPSGDVVIFGKLTIAAGTTVQMDPGAKISVQKDGRLKADGTSSAITFTAATSGVSNHWLGIEILGFPDVPHQPSISDASSMTVSYSYWPSFVPPLTTDQKGAAYLTYCTIEYCNYGVVVGQISSVPWSIPAVIPTSRNPYTGHGGGTLYCVHNTFQYTDYVGIFFTPIEDLPGTNASVVQYNNIYCDYNNSGFCGIALYDVNMGNIIKNSIVNHEILGTSVISLLNYVAGNGVFTYEAGFTFYGNTITGFNVAININDLYNSYSKIIGLPYNVLSGALNDMYNNWWDIQADGSTNVNISSNTSTKDMSGAGGGGANVNSITISGDNWMLYDNTSSLSTTLTGGLDIGIWHPDASTPLGKKIGSNVFDYWTTAIQSQQDNFGALFYCNQFWGTGQDIAITSGGVAASQEYDATHGVNNQWYSSDLGYCPTSYSDWDQSPGLPQVNYHYAWSSMYPYCTGGDIKMSQLAPVNGDCEIPVHSLLGYKNYNQAELDTVVAALVPMPDPGVLDSAHHDLYVALSLRRDIYLSQIIQYYVDTAFIDSAFYMISAYPCLRANIDKMNLLLTLDSAYGDYTGLATSISNGFSLCNSGTGHCDNTYYDNNLSTEATTYYPMIIDLKNHYFSDSVIDAYNTTLTGMADVNSYYGVVCRKILQLYQDSTFQVYIPHDSSYSRTILYPLTAETPYVWGGAAPQIAGFPKGSLAGQWKFYPNPVSSTLNIAAPEQLRNEDAMPYMIYSELGKEVSKGTFTPGSEAVGIDVSSLSKGIYILQIMTSQSIEKYNFVKQ